MLPSYYEINVAKRDGIGWNGKPAYTWFCRVNAGGSLTHAQKVAEAVKNAFPAPEYHVTLHQCYESSREVDNFDWRVEV